VFSELTGTTESEKLNNKTFFLGYLVGKDAKKLFDAKRKYEKSSKPFSVKK